MQTRAQLHKYLGTDLTYLGFAAENVTLNGNRILKLTGNHAACLKKVLVFLTSFNKHAKH